MDATNNSNVEREIAHRLFGYSRPDQVPDHPPVPLVRDSDVTKFKIQVIVPHRPGYIGGRGPSLTRLLNQPEHNKTGFKILDYTEVAQGNTCNSWYTVCRAADPSKHIRVQPEHILNLVSQRTLEEFSCKEFDKFVELERLKKQRKQEEEYSKLFDARGKPIPLKSAKKKAGGPGRSKKLRQTSMEADEDDIGEVLPVKKKRAARRLVEASESENETVPSLSQPSLSRPISSMKRKLSAFFTKESTPGESTDETADEVLQAMEVRRQSKKLSIRERSSSSPRAFKTASPGAKEPKRTLSAQVAVVASPFRKEPLAAASMQPHGSANRKQSFAQAASMPPPASESSTKIIPGTPKPLFPVFGARQKPTAASEPPRSISKILPPERKNIPPSASKNARK